MDCYERYYPEILQNRLPNEIILCSVPGWNEKDRPSVPLKKNIPELLRIMKAELDDPVS